MRSLFSCIPVLPLRIGTTAPLDQPHEMNEDAGPLLEVRASDEKPLARQVTDATDPNYWTRPPAKVVR
jgi:hypothetical protein